MNIEKIGNIELPSEFKCVLTRFEQKYNEKAFSILAELIGFDWVVDKNEVRGYELVPFEAELPFPTGSNGEHMGWLNLCPSMDSFMKPFICWVPLGQHIFYHGQSMNEILENSVSYLHGPNYEQIDQEFLIELGVRLEKSNEILLVNYEN